MKRPHNKGKKCTKRRLGRVKGVKGGKAKRCVSWGDTKKGAKRRLKGRKKCRYGVNKITKKCLKHPRKRRS
jgi:hypothetical protein